MATVEIMEPTCHGDNCARRATRMLRDKQGDPMGMYCVRCAEKALREQTKKENGK